MLAKPVRRDEQIKLIMECRQSGLTDFEWCRQHNINVGTFYNWVKHLKHAEGITFPRGNKAGGTCAYNQEVVKLDVLQTPVHYPALMTSIIIALFCIFRPIGKLIPLETG